MNSGGIGMALGATSRIALKENFVNGQPMQVADPPYRNMARQQAAQGHLGANVETRTNEDDSSHTYQRTE
jgi:hypothetical protein